MLEMPGDIHVRSSLCSGTLAPLPCNCTCWLCQLGAGFRSGYTGNSVRGGRSDCAVYCNRHLRQCETRFDAEYNQRGELDLQQSSRGDRQCFRAGNGCRSWHVNDHSRRNGVQWSCQLQRNLVATGAGGGTAGGNILSLTVIPSAITVGNLQDTGQFLAIGTFSTSPFVRDLTNSTTLSWISSVPSVFPVNNTSGTLGATAGIVTAYGAGSGIIVAEAKSSDGTVQTATATFTCPVPDNPPKPGQCYPGSQAPSLLATLTVYNEGLNTTNWEVTAPSATGTPNVLHCGPGFTTGSVCVATYPVGSTVTLTAPATGAAFGGWSYNCTNTGPITAAGPNSCTVTLTTNDTVGAIFN